MKNKNGIRILIPKYIVLRIWHNKSCWRKNRHFTPASAERQIAQLERRGLASLDSLKVYSCQFCGAYHVGHKQKAA